MAPLKPVSQCARVLVMDEPFGALDHQTRELMQELLLGIWEAEQKTVLLVTHDIDEAIFMGSRVMVMSARPGRIKIERAVPFANFYAFKDEEAEILLAFHRAEMAAQDQWLALARKTLNV